MSHILIVEDNQALSEEVARHLADNGNVVSVVATAAGLWQALASSHFDIVVLDLGLPDEEGVSIVHQLRMRQPEIGLVVLTARAGLSNQLQALDLGADHYLTKPAKLAVLQSVIGTLSRRLALYQTPVGILSPWRLQTSARELQLGDLPAIKLTEKEFQFLILLSRSPHAMSRDAILIALGEHADVDARRKLDMVAYRLRKKVLAEFNQKLPLTMKYGEGYCLTMPLRQH